MDCRFGFPAVLIYPLPPECIASWSCFRVWVAAAILSQEQVHRRVLPQLFLGSTPAEPIKPYKPIIRR